MKISRKQAEELIKGRSQSITEFYLIFGVRAEYDLSKVVIWLNALKTSERMVKNHAIHYQ